jgi:hypothetical protein
MHSGVVSKGTWHHTLRRDSVSRWQASACPTEPKCCPSRKCQTMATETIGKFQLHLFAYEVPGSGRWKPYFSVHRFDDALQDFVCISEKQPVSGEAFASYEQAIEAGRRAGTALVLSKAL